MFCGLCPIICALRTQAAAQGPLSFICFHCSLIIICICGYRNLCCPFDLNSNHQHPCGSRASLSVRMADMQCNVLQYEAALTSRCTEWHPWHLHCLCTHIYRNTWSKYFLRFWKIIHTPKTKEDCGLWEISCEPVLPPTGSSFRVLVIYLKHPRGDLSWTWPVVV